MLCEIEDAARIRGVYGQFSALHFWNGRIVGSRPAQAYIDVQVGPRPPVILDVESDIAPPEVDGAGLLGGEAVQSHALLEAANDLRIRQIVLQRAELVLAAGKADEGLIVVREVHVDTDLQVMALEQVREIVRELNPRVLGRNRQKALTTHWQQSRISTLWVPRWTYPDAADPRWRTGTGTH